MGFGILLYGFLMMVEVSVTINYTYMVGIDVFPDLAGYILMLTAAYRLSDYAKGFRYFKMTLFPLTALSLVSYAASIAAVLPSAARISAEIISISRYIQYPLQFMAFVFMYLGIYSLSQSVNLPKIASRARFGMIMASVYYISKIAEMFVSELGLGISSSASMEVLRAVLMLAFAVFVLYTLFVIFNCYMYICYEGEENPELSGTYNPIQRLFERLKGGKSDKK